MENDIGTDESWATKTPVKIIFQENSSWTMEPVTATRMCSGMSSKEPLPLRVACFIFKVHQKKRKGEQPGQERVVVTRKVATSASWPEMWQQS